MSKRRESKLPFLLTSKAVSIVGGIFLALIIATVAFFHVHKIGNIPDGIFTDEAALGSEGLSLAKTGHDLNGQVLPFFVVPRGQATGPLYIYTSSLLFFTKAGESLVATLRLTSATFFFILFISFLLFSTIAFGRKQIFYAALSAGFLPWYFALSRIGFDAITQPAMLMLAILSIYWTFVFSPKVTYPNAFLTGVVLGISAYSYPTARMLTFLMIGLVLLLFCRRNLFYKCMMMLFAFSLMLIPFFHFALDKSASMFSRFTQVSFIFDSSTSITYKLHLFFYNYIAHLAPHFLVVAGDSNPRHATGYGGQIFLTTLFLSVTGLIGLAKSIAAKNVYSSKKKLFWIFILLNAACAPILSALTNEAVPHSLRSAGLGVYFLIFAGLGLDFLVRIFKKKFCYIIIVICLLTSLEASFYVFDYFFKYPSRSVGYFGGKGVEQSFLKAAKEHPEKIVVSDKIDYYHYLLFSLAIEENKQPIFQQVSTFNLDGKICVVGFDSEEVKQKINSFYLASKDEPVVFCAK